MEALSIEDYIKENFPTKSAFARHMGVKPQQITQWVNCGMVIIDGVMYLPRRSVIEAIQSAN